MTKTKGLRPIPTVLLGPASGSQRPRIECDGRSWCVVWANPVGDTVRATAPLDGGDWTRVKRGEQSKPALERLTNGDGQPDEVVAWAGRDRNRVALRLCARRLGIRPQFPSAGLVLSRAIDGSWLDLAFADDTPDGKVIAGALGEMDGQFLAAYLLMDEMGGVTCRALRYAPKDTGDIGGLWEPLPDYPFYPGVAGVIAGVHDGVLIAAGGANFPDRPPWEGGVKKILDQIFVLPRDETVWQPAGRLPTPRAYAASVSTPKGVLVIGGESDTQICSDVMLLRWDGRRVDIAKTSPLPAPVTNPVAAVLGQKVYLAGGFEPGTPRLSSRSFCCLDLMSRDADWEILPSWPGPPRAQGVMAALEGALYLVSGLDVNVGAGGQAGTSYLKDAYRYWPGRGWELLPNLPWSVVAAPSPAPVTTSPPRVFAFGGVDGRQAGLLPRDTLVPEDVVYFDVAEGRWRLWPEAWPTPAVNVPVVADEGRWIFVSGETMAGKRTTAVRAWRPGSPSTGSA